MSIEIVTKEDLHMFRLQLLEDLKCLFAQQLQPTSARIEGYKTADVRKILGCSINKLTSLRITRKLRVKKIGGTLYYNKDDVKKLLEEGYQS